MKIRETTAPEQIRMNLEILDSAIKDLEKGRVFYERQDEGIGDYFLNSLFSEIDSLAMYAGIHRLIFGYHRLLSRRFPYAIYYKVDGGRAIVYRVLDCRRNPGKADAALGQ